MIRPSDVDPAEAPDEYTRAMWAASFDTQQYKDDNREVYHLFKDLLTKTEEATWFEKVKDVDRRAAHMLLREHYVGEAHDMRRAAAANAKLRSFGRVRPRFRSRSTCHVSTKHSRSSKMPDSHCGRHKR